MKKQIFATSIVLFCFSLSLLPAQQALSLRDMKKNGLYIDAVAPFAKKELRFGYERRLRPNLSLNLGFGFGLKNEDPDYSEIDGGVESYVFTRWGHSDINWYFFIPTGEITYSSPLPEEESSKEVSNYIRSRQFASAELKYFLSTNRKNKLPYGFYAALGLAGGRQVYSSYHYSDSTRNEIEVYDMESNTSGIPLVDGRTIQDWTEKVTVFEYQNRTREIKTQYYLHTYLRGGYQLPIGRSFTADLSGQLLFKKRKEAVSEKSEFPFFSGPGSDRQKVIQTSMALRVTYWFF